MKYSANRQQNRTRKASESKIVRFLVSGFILLLAVLSVTMPISAKSTPKMLYPGGMPFGIRFSTDGIIAVGFCDVTENGVSSSPARDAGLKENDCIKVCNGEKLQSAEQFTRLISESGGKALTLEISRGGQSLSLTVTPKKSDADGRYKSGMWIRDSGAGIGTVTFVVPEEYLFAGLGHGICSSGHGDLIPMSKGTIYAVRVNDIIKGTQGDPGELRGQFTAEKLGTLLGNTDLGMFGVLIGIPEAMKNDPRCTPLPIATRDEVREGKATIYSTLDENGIGEYEIEISDIRHDATAGKCFTVKVTDQRLIEKSGGIVQGMSGSPIIQNGKLIGAVTHVLINDPTTGYGIFIENMLNAAQMPMAKAS